MSAQRDAATKRLCSSALMKFVYFKALLTSFSNSVLTILLGAAADLSLPRSMPAGRVAGITQGASVRVSDLDAVPEPSTPFS
jgi:hypothetical protein